MIEALLRPLAWLPLRWIHAFGALLGWLVYFASPVYAARLRDNLQRSRLARDEADYRRLLRRNIAETGKSFLEIAAVWLRDEARAARLVIACDEVDVSARAAPRGIIFLTPHMGCFEVCAIYAAQRQPITVLYRPPRLKWLEPLMIAGRGRGRVRLAATDLQGVRRLYLALRSGEAVGLLPDQAPRFGEGEWAPFFGRPAYTATLATRLRASTGARMILAFAERLPAGRGYRIHLRELDESVRDAAALNRALEDMIRVCPEQYLWSYDRYKIPAGVAPPAASEPCA